MSKVLVITGAVLVAILGAACAKDEATTPAAGSPMMPAMPMSPGMSPMMDEHMDHGSTSESAEIPQDAKREEVRAVEYAFDPDSLEVEAGRPLAVTFENEGTTGHDYTVHDANGEQVEGGHSYADAGERATLVVTLEPGTYQVWCTIAGHRQAGMEATITAT